MLWAGWPQRLGEIAQSGGSPAPNNDPFLKELPVAPGRGHTQPIPPALAGPGTPIAFLFRTSREMDRRGWLEDVSR
jgi:hypothetical protein